MTFTIDLLKTVNLKKSAVTAVMCKILVTAMGVLKNQQPFDPNWAEKTRNFSFFY